NSLHMQGRAIDIRLPDVPLVRLRAAALSLRKGGVGYYPSSNFVHVDTGRVRSW
ncbi:MAG: YcbK family protein, partial [Gemmatimonadales bacterium]